MIPVLSVDTIDRAALETLGLHCRDHSDGTLATFRDQGILVVTKGTVPDGFIPMRFDHIALGVNDVEQEAADGLARGARLSADFTPDGPKSIPEFWDKGVRFVFFDAPANAPLELCQNLAATNSSNGHDHYAIRTGNLDKTSNMLGEMGATVLATYRLDTPDGPVNVRFLGLNGRVFELFDEAGGRAHKDGLGWIGLVPHA